MLISRLYKSKNNPANNKQIPKPEQDTNLLFYQTKKKSFREEEPRKILPILAVPKRPSLEDEIPSIEASIGSARRTSRGGSFHKEAREQS